MLTSDGGTFAKIFGTGLAFPVRTNDGMTCPDPTKPQPRADSYSLYLNFVANTVLKQLVPKYQLESKLQLIRRTVNRQLAAKQ
jgi:hypothetical protein